MAVFRLAPRPHDPPRCDSYEDPDAVRAFERATRVHRAYTEGYSLSREGDGVLGTWRVRGTAGNEWCVDLVDGSGEHDNCNCPDFLFNDLGTCKHLEAVRRAIASRPALRAAAARAPRRPARPALVVSAVGGLAVRAVGPWKRARLDSLGFDGDTLRDPLALPGDAATLPGEATHAVAPALARLRERETLRRRARTLGTAFDRGRWSADVLTRPLFPYQRDGVRHLVVRGRAVLADDMGLGKTVQAIAACEILRARGEAARILVVTSASLKDQWAREIHTYAGVDAVVVSGGAARRQDAFESDAPYKILNYELTWKELSRLQRFDADVLILDEAQRAKNFRTKTAATLRAVPSRFLFVLTGTPVENRLDDLYSLLQLVDPTVLGPLWKFNQEFHTQNDRGRVTGYQNLARLRERIAPVVLRRRKEEVLSQLPPVTEQTRYTPLSKPQQELELGYRQSAAALIQIAERRPLSPEEHQRLMAVLLKARQACSALELCNPKSRIKASPKLDEFESLIGEIAAQGTSKVLVFSEWLGMLRLAAKRLDRMKVRYALLHGGVPSDRRPALLDRFRGERDVRVLLSTDAGGVGLNLQVATYVVHLDLPWNPARLDQRTARAHRLGQTRGVSVTYLCAESGIERGIEGTLAGKRAVRSAALDAASDVDRIETQSFSAFVRQLQSVLVATEAGEAADAGATERGGTEGETLAAGEATAGEGVEAGEAGEGVEAGEAGEAGEAALAEQAPVVTPAATEAVGPEPAESSVAPAPAPMPTASDAGAGSTVGAPSPGRSSGSERARNRLRLARVVLDAGFPGDAVRAAYDALAAAVRALAESPVAEGHAALVAAAYRELIPSGRLPAAAHAVLARLNDLAALEQYGVAVDADLARETVAEAEQWVERIGTAGASEQRPGEATV